MFRYYFLQLLFQIIFNATSEGLQDYYPLDMLPNEWGGKAGTMEELNGNISLQFNKYTYFVHCIGIQCYALYDLCKT